MTSSDQGAAPMSLLHSTVLKFQILAERLQGVDFTSANVRPSELGLDESKVYISAPSGDRFLVRVFKDLRIGPEDAVLDIGCAKGSALRQLAKFPFARADGIELAPAMAAIARRNFDRIGPGPGGRRVKVFCMDARAFRQYGDYNFFYIYNPFPPEVLDEVLEPLVAQAAPDVEQIVVYNNPVGHEVMLRHGFHARCRYPDFWGHGIVVYSNLAQGGRILAQ
jgi:SAM-dependent methyltransferase